EPTKEIILLNWAKHNWNNSPKIVSRVEKELEDVKHIPFVEKYLSIVDEYKSDKVSIQYQYPINEASKPKNENVDVTGFDTSSIPYPYSMHTKDNDNDKEKDKEKDKDNDKEVAEIIQFWDNNGFGYNNINSKKKLLSWLDDSDFKNPKEMILKAMEIACAQNKRHLGYVQGILRNWTNESVLTVEEIKTRNSNEVSFNESTNYEDSVGDYGIQLYK